MIYDAAGRRISKAVGGDTTEYVYDGDQVIAEYDDSGEIIRKYIYSPGIDEPICMIAGSDTYWYHRDGLGSVVALSKYDSSAGFASIVERYTYDPFGQTTVCDGNGTPRQDNLTAFANPYQYTGRRYDPETGLYYYRARMYDTELGRFLQPDPIGYADGMNMYAYVGNNPTTFIDPLGLRQWSGLLRPNAMVRIQAKSGKRERHHISDVTDLVMVLIEHAVSKDEIVSFEYYGHGDTSGEGLNIEVKDKKSYITGIFTEGNSVVDNKNAYGLGALRGIIEGAFAVDAKISLNACYSANGKNSIASGFKEILPNADVFGYTGVAMVDPLFGKSHPADSGSEFVEMKSDTKGCENES
ncbi:Cell wall-associated polypeptide CWBP200 [Anaerohalosphaera lusitana]|uniref:Cell wall-associated polypeptide CWBP200 n=1 Tax=Anaerohalosphaera lusitana TaxID=1936003 RepID=A0A1U9NHH1_9BACT|nr:RHS repeat-associated core domain-containing protein [Anaerohalosphaera lusitana]AQT67208.1 Cell wall-associated polypeptide CWBP200 [Anaerohalosphaera lusitana]